MGVHLSDRSSDGCPYNGIRQEAEFLQLMRIEEVCLVNQQDDGGGMPLPLWAPRMALGGAGAAGAAAATAAPVTQIRPQLVAVMGCQRYGY